LLIVLTVADLLELLSQAIILCLRALPEAVQALLQRLWLHSAAVGMLTLLKAANAGAAGCTWRRTRGTGLQQQQEGNANSTRGSQARSKALLFFRHRDMHRTTTTALF
jgi:hypothetical protein